MVIRRKVEGEGGQWLFSLRWKDAIEVPCWYSKGLGKTKVILGRAILFESVCDDVDDWNEKDLHSVITTRMMLMPIMRSWLNLSPNGE